MDWSKRSRYFNPFISAFTPPSTIAKSALLMVSDRAGAAGDGKKGRCAILPFNFVPFASTLASKTYQLLRALVAARGLSSLDEILNVREDGATTRSMK